MKKIILLFVSLLLIMTVACSKDVHAKENEEQNSPATEQIDKEKEKDTEEDNVSQESFLNTPYSYMGFNFMHPENNYITSTSCGEKFEYDASTAVIVAAPASIGEFLAVSSLDDVVDACKKYIYKDLEKAYRMYFTIDSTEQKVDKVEKVSHNGIEMLRVSGVFANISSNTDVQYVAYYFLTETDPVYTIGFSLVDPTASPADFMDEFASKITK